MSGIRRRAAERIRCSGGIRTRALWWVFDVGGGKDGNAGNRDLGMRRIHIASAYIYIFLYMMNQSKLASYPPVSEKTR